ncbi:hypothetical protein QPX54_06490 [Corynebacterium propinquum]|uniref:Uncharacterized protein n=1 Tax=Corynebacterium propinquum TaxID=43769 RepID=A0AAP4BV83_9CORY|nr:MULTISPECIES: hypothetical protein [Corynebacterium]MDK4238578.1 hypothetical protein [Corynebacterium propinquum]MDK4288689.1 hypothetical protein [Corynebacterium pseudodiphtheriticum]MDK4326161.1 hypothetical protein [Corynebacterium propinquum]DAX64379.1 MAG TPA: hypothetical protein [Caudoviricetes sp.]
MGTYQPRVMFRNRQVSSSKWYRSPLIDSISLQWGRAGVFDQPAPSIAKFRVYSANKSDVKNLIPKGPIGEIVEFHAVKDRGTGGQEYRIFIGRVIDATIHISRDANNDPKYILDFTAADMLRELSINRVGSIQTFNPQGSSRGVAAAFTDFSREFSRQGLTSANMTFSPEVKTSFNNSTVYLGDFGDSTWKDYLDKIFRVALNQSYYFDPLSRKLTGTSLPVLYTKNKNSSKFMNSDEMARVTTIIDTSKTSGDQFLEYSPDRVGLISTETYSRAWKLQKNALVVDRNYQSKSLATLNWHTRLVGSLDFSQPHLVVNYAKQDALLPRPPRLEFHARGNNIDDPDHWLIPNDSTYADLRWTDHAKLLKELGFLEQPLAKPISGEISYSGRHGWKITQELAWALQNISAN